MDDHTLIGEETVDGLVCWKIKSIFKEGDSFYDEKIVWVSQKVQKPIKSEYCGAQGLIKTYSVGNLG